MTWFEFCALAGGPLVIFAVRAWLACDTNQWRWHRP
jgi:hypothetical protein